MLMFLGSCDKLFFRYSVSFSFLSVLLSVPVFYVMPAFIMGNMIMQRCKCRYADALFENPKGPRCEEKERGRCWCCLLLVVE